jgi:zinc/manganese transport system ATP-binding protein
VIRLDNLTVSYQRHPVLHHLSGEFEKGSLTAIVGPNGAGKSTLLKSLLGLLPIEGRITLSCARPRIAYLPQQAEIDRSFPISVLDCVLLGFWQISGVLGGLSPSSMDKAASALRSVGLNGFAQRPVGELSTGQFQRVLFARLLVQDAELILLDEPFTAIDSRTTSALLGLIAEWHQQGRTIIAVVHDDTQVREFFPQCLLLARQAVAWGETAKVMTPEHLQQAKLMAETWEHNEADPVPLCEIAVDL